MPQLLSIQVGLARRIRIGERSILTGYGKQPVAGGVSVMPLGLPGDEQADLSIHGGLEKAVYAYPSEHYAYWQAARREAGVGQIDDSLPHGGMGENLTLQGLLETGVWDGDVFSAALTRQTPLHSALPAPLQYGPARASAAPVRSRRSAPTAW